MIKLLIASGSVKAYSGTEREVIYTRLENCQHCSGSGCAPGKSPGRCAKCNGTGTVSFAQGFFAINTTCDRCRGTGQVIDYPCPRCHGRGRVEKKRKVKVKVPAGIDTGMYLQLTGEGEAPAAGNGPQGDLYIEVSVREHKFFKRDGRNIYLEIPISMSQAVLGDDLNVPTLNGNKKLNIPSGTQTHTVLKIKNAGMQSSYGGRGDQFVRVLVKTPKGISGEEKSLYQNLEKLEKDREENNSKSFLEKVHESIKRVKKDVFG